MRLERITVTDAAYKKLMARLKKRQFNFILLTIKRRAGRWAIIEVEDYTLRDLLDLDDDLSKALEMYVAAGGPADTLELRRAFVLKRHPHAVCVREEQRNGKKDQWWFRVYDRAKEPREKLGWGGNPRGAWGHARR